jgi:hypothetical protein
MSETVEIYKALKDHRRELRAKHGVQCPRCRETRPRANPSILLPQQRCKVDGYRDPRPELQQNEIESE